MKRYVILLFVILLSCSFANAELPDLGTAETPAPAGDSVTCDYFDAVLPYGFTAMSADELTGYEAAVNNAYPFSGDTILAAIGPDSAAICVSAAESTRDTLEAAQNASLSILGDASYASETTLGENTYGTFACSVSSQRYDFYFINKSGTLFVFAFCGIDSSAISDFMCTVKFSI